MSPKYFWYAFKLLLLANWPEQGYTKGYFNNAIMYVFSAYIKAGFGII